MTEEAPILARDPADLPAELPRGSELPADHDPLAAGVMMQHQLDWIADKSDLKLAEKGRRTGVTYAEALDDTLIAASARSSGGDNIFYIGDTKDKGCLLYTSKMCIRDRPSNGRAQGLLHALAPSR